MLNYKNEFQSTFDVIIIGGGINGCGIAREFSLQKKRVLLLEKSTIGSGTSSKSSRLIHGGLRYLESFQFNLVRESLKDREELLKLYPHLVQMKPFYFPCYKQNSRTPFLIWMGLKLYDMFSGWSSEYPSKTISLEDFGQLNPSIKQDGLRKVFRFFDAKTNDLKLTKQVAEDAQLYGATIHENTQIQKISWANDQFNLETDHKTFSSQILINATGPWIHEVNKKYSFPAQYHIRKISGIHLMIKGLLTHDIMFMQTQGKRIFFIIPEPEENQTMIGTTEREENSPTDDVIINSKDINYMIDNINYYLKPEYRISESDVISTSIGIRPLVAANKNPTNLSREYCLDLHTSGNSKLLHVFGGKLTTFLSLSRKAVDLLTG